MSRSATFIRERRTYCGTHYMTVDLYQYTEAAQQAARAPRRRREKVSAPKQKNLNDKRARRYFIQLANANFGPGDFHVSLTYSPGYLPDSEEAAKREAKNFLRRVDRRRKKLGLPPLKYILVTECGIKKATGCPVRIHHHIIMSGGFTPDGRELLTRDDLELMWTRERVNWKRAERDLKYRQSVRRIGFVNTDRLQPGENGMEALCRYLTKDPAGKKRWSCSQNLEKPVQTTNDSKYSIRKLEGYASSGAIWDTEFWEKQYPGYTLAGAPDMALEVTPPDDVNNWIIFAKLRKVEPPPTPPTNRKARTRREELQL